MFFFIMCHASCIMNRESFPPACTTNHALSTFLAMHTRSFDHAPYLTPHMDLSWIVCLASCHLASDISWCVSDIAYLASRMFSHLTPRSSRLANGSISHLTFCISCVPHCARRSRNLYMHHAWIFGNLHPRLVHCRSCAPECIEHSWSRIFVFRIISRCWYLPVHIPHPS